MFKRNEAIKQIKRDKKVFGFVDKINKALRKVDAPIDLRCWRDRDTCYHIEIYNGTEQIVSFEFDYNEKF